MQSVIAQSARDLGRNLLGKVPDGLFDGFIALQDVYVAIDDWFSLFENE
jgi:hypothetical protein